MKKFIIRIIHSILTGKDYRTYVLATINKRFIDKVQELTSEIFEYKREGDNWLEKLLDDTYKKKGKDNKFKLLWFGGLNDKTVKNMTGGTSKKEVCLDLGKDKEPLTVELKLLGIGNPEIGDEALARKVDLFLIDRLTDMMKRESEKIGVKVIEFRQENPLMEIYKFFISKNVNCSPPEEMSSKLLEDKINQIIDEWRESKEELRIIKKLKELTK